MHAVHASTAIYFAEKFPPRGRIQTTLLTTEGEGVAQMSTLLNNCYLVEVSTKGEGDQKCPKFCICGLYKPPYMGKI